MSVVKNESQSVETIWLAFVSWFEEHPCGMAYSLYQSLMLITNVRCCSVFLKTSVNFGRYVGVYIATPIEG